MKRFRPAILGALLCAFTSLFQQYATGQTNYTQLQKLLAADGEELDAFGYSASISADGNTAIVGAPYDLITAPDYFPGSAYIFVRNTVTNIWTQQAKLVPSDGASNDAFGYFSSISADGNTAIVSAWGHDVGANTDVGQVYIYTRSGTTWTQQAILHSPTGVSNNLFGWSVDVSGDGTTAIVGVYDN